MAIHGNRLTIVRNPKDELKTGTLRHPACNDQAAWLEPRRSVSGTPDAIHLSSTPDARPHRWLRGDRSRLAGGHQPGRRLVDPRHASTAATLERALLAVGRRLAIEVEKAPWDQWERGGEKTSESGRGARGAVKRK